MKLTLNIKKLSFWGFLFVLLVYPYLFILNILLPSTLLGNNSEYIYGITFVLIVIFLLNYKMVFKIIPKWIVLVFFLLVTNVSVLNLIFYSEIKHPDVLRIPFNLIIYLGLSYIFTSDAFCKKAVYTAVLSNCVIQSLLGAIHYFYFPHIEFGAKGTVIIKERLGATPGAERGILENPNVFSLFLLLGCFLIAFRDNKLKKNSIVETICFLALITGIVLSNSRFGLICSVILFALYFLKLPAKGKVFIASLAIIAISVSHGYLEQRMNHAYRRTIREDGYKGTYLSRSTKNANAFALLTADLASTLIGPSREKIIQFKIVEGKRYSDNSFLMLFHDYGLPTGVMVILGMILIYSKTIEISKKGSILLLSYFITALFIYNSILFDIWLLFFSASLMLLFKKDNNLPLSHAS